MPEGKYFLIRSKLNPDLALDVEASGTDPGTRVITYPAHGGSNQLWYQDHVSGTVRSKANDMCLDLSGNRLCINPHNTGEENQLWECRGDHVCGRQDNNKVLDIVAASGDEGAEVCCWECHGGENQSWTFEHQEPNYFFIESKLNGKVLDVCGADPSPGVGVIMWGKKDDTEPNQLWYENKHGVIASKLNDLVLDGSGGPLVMSEFNPDEHSHWWLLHEDKVANRHNLNLVFDIRASNEDDGAEVLPYELHGGNNQLWNFIPA